MTPEQVVAVVIKAQKDNQEVFPFVDWRRLKSVHGLPVHVIEVMSPNPQPKGRAQQWNKETDQWEHALGLNQIIDQELQQFEDSVYYLVFIILGYPYGQHCWPDDMYLNLPDVDSQTILPIGPVEAIEEHLVYKNEKNVYVFLDDKPEDEWGDSYSPTTLSEVKVPVSFRPKKYMSNDERPELIRGKHKQYVD